MRRLFRPPAPPAPGLYTYRYAPAGGQVRVHLRVEPNRSAVIFVDVTDVIHLNSTAMELAKWALDGVPPALVRRWLKRRHRRWLPSMERDLRSIYDMVQRFQQPSSGCPTCALQDVSRVGWFQTNVAAPFKADLALTYACNNDCPHCYNEVDRLPLRSLPLDGWKAVVDRLVKVGVPHLIFTGGEATLHPDLPALVQYANRLGPVCGLNSNGRRFSHGDYATRMAAAGLNHLQVTLGSHRADVHDRMMNAHCFGQTVRGIRRAMEAGIHTITNTTLMRMNAHDMPETVAFLHDLGVRTFAVNGMIYSGGGLANSMAIPEDEMPARLVQIRDTARRLGMRFLWYTPTQYCRLSPVELEIGAKRCNAGEYSICIEPNGDVLPCQSYYVAAGNILRDPWDSIWQGALFHSFRNRDQHPVACGLPEMCWECPDLPTCGGGCRIEREAAEGRRVDCNGCGTGGCGSGPSSNVRSAFVALHTLEASGARRGTGQFAESSVIGLG